VKAYERRGVKFLTLDAGEWSGSLSRRFTPGNSWTEEWGEKKNSVFTAN
jgi:hypothetical protein